MENTQALKEQVVAYFKSNRVPLRMQDALNVMFHASPPDPNGFVSTYFEDLSIVPTVTRIMALNYLDSKGQPAVSVKVFCVMRNKEVCVGESHISIDTSLPDGSKPEEKEAEDTSRASEVENSIVLINNDLREILVSANPQQQNTLDEKMYNEIESRRLDLLEEENRKAAEGSSPDPSQDEAKKGKKSGKGGSAKKKGPQVVIVPDQPKESPYPGCHAVTALSQALCIAGASLAKVPVYDHLISCFGGNEFSIKLPRPVITIIQGGKSASGKCNSVKEYMLFPREDMPPSEAITTAAKVQESVTRSFSSKLGISVKYLTDQGSICPTLDKPEQALDAIAEGITQAGYEMGKDFFLMLNASAHEYFDYDKGKYEVMAGMLKAPDDMADYWADICNRYPAVVGLIDPIRNEEKEQWNKICSAVSSRCLVICDKGYSRPALLNKEILDYHQFATSGIVLRLEGSNTITDVFDCTKRMMDHDNTVILASGQHDTSDTTIVDVAVACQATFVKLGAVARGERVAKYNRLLEIESELGERKAEWKALTFPEIPPKPKTPAPEPHADDPGQEAEKN